jgi:nitrate reductase assembly molybdenum cofactor insertion protein NarJ
MTTDVRRWDLLAAALDYPVDTAYIERIARCAQELEAEATECGEFRQVATALAQMGSEMARCGTGTLQERYTAAFDFDPACSLDIGWHLFSDGPERGPWLAAVREDLMRAGIEETGELPDHLTHLLRLIPREDRTRSAELAEVVAPVVANIRDRLAARANTFAALLDAALCLLATERKPVGTLP